MAMQVTQKGLIYNLHIDANIEFKDINKAIKAMDDFSNWMEETKRK
jgi:hypothetical protein